MSVTRPDIHLDTFYNSMFFALVGETGSGTDRLDVNSCKRPTPCRHVGLVFLDVARLRHASGRARSKRQEKNSRVKFVPTQVFFQLQCVTCSYSPWLRSCGRAGRMSSLYRYCRRAPFFAAWHTQLQDHLDHADRVARLRPSWRMGSWREPSGFARTNGRPLVLCDTGLK